MKRLIFLLIILIVPASGYTIDGEVYTNDTLADMVNVTMNIQNYTVLTNVSGNFLFNQSFAAGNYTVNLTNSDVRYRNMAINITLSSNLYMSIAVPLKPTGTITGRVCTFPGCAIAQAVALASNRIRWFF
jgi:hypothetical protein